MKTIGAFQLTFYFGIFNYFLGIFNILFDDPYARYIATHPYSLHLGIVIVWLISITAMTWFHKSKKTVFNYWWPYPSGILVFWHEVKEVIFTIFLFLAWSINYQP